MTNSDPKTDAELEEDAIARAQEQAAFADEMETDAEDQAEDAPKEDSAPDLEGQLAETKDQLMRALAEIENTRRRAQKDRQDASKFAVQGFAKDMLSVADNLRRALDAMPEDAKSNEQMKNLIEGIEATEREMLRTFEKNGIQKLNPEGEMFNPNFHEVMFETPIPGQPAGTIIQVIEVGYMLNERLLRPARVGVAKDDGSGTPPPNGGIDTEV